MKTVVYSKPACVACRQTQKTLDNNGVAYNKIDVTEDATAYDFVTKTLGHMAAPVVAVFNAAGEVIESWSGFNPDKLKTLVAA